VKFGIGRYLYRLPQQWCDYDPQKRQFVRPPSLPASVLPRPAENKGKSAQPAREAPAAAAPEKKPAARPTPPQPQAGPREANGTGNGPARASALPANGLELQKRLSDYDARLAKQGLCRPGDLVKHVVQAGVQAGFVPDLSAWTGPAITLAVEETRAFEGRLREQPAAKKDVA
jgi:hypothetical protein